MNSATDLKGGDDVVDDNDEGVDEQIGTGLRYLLLYFLL